MTGRYSEAVTEAPALQTLVKEDARKAVDAINTAAQFLRDLDETSHQLERFASTNPVASEYLNSIVVAVAGLGVALDTHNQRATSGAEA